MVRACSARGWRVIGSPGGDNITELGGLRS